MAILCPCIGITHRFLDSLFICISDYHVYICTLLKLKANVWLEGLCTMLSDNGREVAVRICTTCSLLLCYTGPAYITTKHSVYSPAFHTNKELPFYQQQQLHQTLGWGRLTGYLTYFPGIGNGRSHECVGNHQ